MPVYDFNVTIQLLVQGRNKGAAADRPAYVELARTLLYPISDEPSDNFVAGIVEVEEFLTLLRI